MIRHIVFLKWKEGTRDHRIEAVEQTPRRMPETIRHLRRYELGRDLGMTGSHDFAVVADFDTAEDYLAYTEDPGHKAVIAELIAPILESAARIQYEI